MKLSLIIPLYNEEGNLKPLHREISTVLKLTSHEIIFVNDGSNDNSYAVLENLFKADPDHVKVINFRGHFGKASALNAGFSQATGDIVAQMDADLQDDPRFLPDFLAKINEGFDMVVGWKQNRKDTFIKNHTSKFFNSATNFISKVSLHDHNCGFKMYKKEVLDHVNLYGELHRYIAVLASHAGFKVGEVPIEHRKRLSGTTKYGPDRFIKGFLDLMTVIFITKFRSRPLHYFGYIGLSFFSLGFLGAIYLTYVKFFNQVSIGDRPLLLLSVMLMIMGVQVIVTGILGEQITTLTFKNDNDYLIKNKLAKGHV